MFIVKSLVVVNVFVAFPPFILGNISGAALTGDNERGSRKDVIRTNDLKKRQLEELTLPMVGGGGKSALNHLRWL